MPAVTVVARDYPNLYARFTALGPLMTKIGNGGKGIAWNTQHEVEALGALNGVHEDGPAKGLPKIDSDIDAAEVILMLAPETNGEVAVKAWEALSKITGREHAHLALAQGGREDPLSRHPGAAAQDHLLADLVRHREREGLLQCGLHQCACAAEEVRKAETYMSWLATTGSVTPFIGLFGTVWGVMDAFTGLGAAGSASLRAVAPGIAEALITTAAGLFTAVPAVIAYNHFLHNIRDLGSRMDGFAMEVAALVEKLYPDQRG